MSSTTAEASISSEPAAAGRPRRRRVSLLILCLMALGIGVMTGVGAVALRALIGLIHNFMINGVFKIPYDANILEGPSRWGNWVILSPILGGLVVVYLVDRFAPEAKGHGVPEVMDAVFYKRGDIRGVVALIKSLASALSIGSGASVGREGPIIQIGSALGSSFSKAIGPLDRAEDHASLGGRRRGHRGHLQHAARRRPVRNRDPASGGLQPHLSSGGRRDRRGHADRAHPHRPQSRFYGS